MLLLLAQGLVHTLLHLVLSVIGGSWIQALLPSRRWNGVSGVGLGVLGTLATHPFLSQLR